MCRQSVASRPINYKPRCKKIGLLDFKNFYAAIFSINQSALLCNAESPGNCGPVVLMREACTITSQRIVESEVIP